MIEEKTKRLYFCTTCVFNGNCYRQCVRIEEKETLKSKGEEK